MANWMVTINGGTWDGFHACILTLVRLGQQHSRKRILMKIWGSFSYSYALDVHKHCLNQNESFLRIHTGERNSSAGLAVSERNIYPLIRSALTRFLTDPKWKHVNVIAARTCSFPFWIPYRTHWKCNAAHVWTGDVVSSHPGLGSEFPTELSTSPVALEMIAAGTAWPRIGSPERRLSNIRDGHFAMHKESCTFQRLRQFTSGRQLRHVWATRNILDCNFWCTVSITAPFSGDWKSPFRYH